MYVIDCEWNEWDERIESAWTWFTGLLVGITVMAAMAIEGHPEVAAGWGASCVHRDPRLRRMSACRYHSAVPAARP